MIIIKSENHHHFWTENNIVYESYITPQGMCCIKIVELHFDYPNHDKLTESMVMCLNRVLMSKN